MPSPTETAGGGALIDLGVHLVDNVRYVTGDEFAVVAAMRSDRQGGVERNGHVLFRLERGAVGSLKASWNTPYGSGRALVLWGRTGEVSVDRSGAWLRTGAGTVALAAEPAADLYDDFVRACRGEGPAVPGGEDGLAALAVVLAAYASEATATFVRPSGGRNRAPGNESSDQVRVPNR
jgi:predicted dehydrogenase